METRDVEPVPDQCWVTVTDGGPALIRHWVNVPFLLGWNILKRTGGQMPPGPFDRLFWSFFCPRSLIVRLSFLGLNHILLDLLDHRISVGNPSINAKLNVVHFNKRSLIEEAFTVMKAFFWNWKATEV